MSAMEEASPNGLLNNNGGNKTETSELSPATPPNGLMDDGSGNTMKTMMPVKEEPNGNVVETNSADPWNASLGRNCKDGVENMSAVAEANVGLQLNGFLQRNEESASASAMSETSRDTPPNGLLEKIREELMRPSPTEHLILGHNRKRLVQNNEKEEVLPVSQIKQEDPLEIVDDRADQIQRMPIISLTPTSKLLATPNPANPKRKFVCPYENCGKSYGKSSHLRSHLTWHTGIKPFVCQEPNCGKGFTRSDELNRHVRTHTGEKPFECVQCTKKFSRSDHLTKHLATHAKQHRASRRKTNIPVDPSVPKPPIKRNPKRRAGVDIGMGHLRPYAPPLNSRLDTAQTLNASVFLPPAQDYLQENHYRHQPIKIKLERPDNNSDYQIVPTSILKLNTELRRESNTDEEEANEELIIGDDEIMPEANAPPLPLDVLIKSEPEEPKPYAECHPFPCERCPQTFHSIIDLDRHRHEHAVQIPGPVNNGTPSPGVLQPKLEPKASQTIKDPERPYNCKECPKTFRRQDDLQRHVRTHTGEKPYPCNECDRRFVRSDHLKKHLQTHIRVRGSHFASVNGPAKKNS